MVRWRNLVNLNVTIGTGALGTARNLWRVEVACRLTAKALLMAQLAASEAKKHAASALGTLECASLI